LDDLGKVSDALISIVVAWCVVGVEVWKKIWKMEVELALPFSAVLWTVGVNGLRELN
jgi:hypothetical protein